MRYAEIAVLWLLSSSLAFGADGELDAQLRFRSSFESDIQSRIADPILGKGRAFVFVNLELDVLRKEQWNARSGEGRAGRQRDREGAEGFQSQLASQERLEAESRISARWVPKTFDVVVLHDDALPAERVKAARDAIVAAYRGSRLEPQAVISRPTPLRARAAPSAAAGLFPVALAIGLLAAAALPFASRAVAAPVLLGGAFVAVIWHGEGAAGLRPFLNAEALGLVLLGTLAVVGANHPVGALPRALAQAVRNDGSAAERWRSSGVLATAARGAAVSGLAATVLGLILLLSSVADAAELPRRAALALTASLFGLFLSEFLLNPMARRCAGPPS
ncbi:MAG: MotA/TolQ/ExbB proton channel family protein [Elusimicrobia bacterium]|nr:MotA/TolQ/ExbB proton channel family protein [Elusimicrobiota bacterium]